MFDPESHNVSTGTPKLQPDWWSNVFEHGKPKCWWDIAFEAMAIAMEEKESPWGSSLDDID